MSKGTILKSFAYSIGGAGLLLGTLVIVASIAGVPLSSLPLIGGFFPAPPESASAAVDESGAPTIEEEVASDRRPPRQVIDGATSILSSFTMDAPWSGAELTRLEQTLEARIAAVDERERALREREHDLDERARHYEQLYAQIASMQESLIRQRDDAELRQDELDEAEQQLEIRRQESRRLASQLYAEGTKARDAAQRLMDTYSPSEAGKIIAFLDLDRARELMAEIHKIDEQDYPAVEAAYASAVPSAR